ncbi:tetratricopeptide repeat protein [Oribacterium sp. P6A1]|uniref:tetratricopeptide repeat protein n=1 Tax=Oribacterium sp. P6A1 TaxID=1410612 RepID=UPI000691E0A7|nr:tetratricopeptide repeat protein [Oribacterium sp. P6A1]
MRIKSKDDLLKRVRNAITTLSKDGRYPESLASLKDAEYEMDINDFEEAKKLLSDSLHDDDRIHTMHPEIAGLLKDIYLDGVEEGDPDYICKLGSLYYTGRAGEQDYVRAAEYYHMAEKGGNDQAVENLGYIYYYGRTGDKDYKKAFNYFVKGAATGNVRSLYKIGDFYRNGFYVEKDPKEAFHIYERCTEMISEELIPEVGADVYMRMGDCYHEGIGVEKDLILALSFMCSAEGLIYRRLMCGDFYQKNNLKHVLESEERIREEIRNELLPDLSWSGFQGDNDDTTVIKEPANTDAQENPDVKNQETDKNAKSESELNVFDMIRKDWDKILEAVREDHDVLKISFDMWLKPLRLFDLIDNLLLIIVPEEGYVKILEKKYSQYMKEILEKNYNIPIEIHFITESEAKKLSKKKNTIFPVKSRKDPCPLGFKNYSLFI